MNWHNARKVLMFFILGISSSLCGVVCRIFDADSNIITYVEVDYGISITRFIDDYGDVYFWDGLIGSDVIFHESQDLWRMLYHDLEHRHNSQ